MNDCDTGNVPLPFVATIRRDAGRPTNTARTQLVFDDVETIDRCDRLGHLADVDRQLRLIVAAVQRGQPVDIDQMGRLVDVFEHMLPNCPGDSNDLVEHVAQRITHNIFEIERLSPR